MKKILQGMWVCFILASAAHADQPWTFSNNTRYMALGDSVAAGYGAVPTTQGYAYLLYQSGAFAAVPDTLFANAAVPGSTSGDVLQHQVPLAVQRFRPGVITISVGGNDLLAILKGADPHMVLANFQNNLMQIFGALRQGLPAARIYTHNQYDVPEITSRIPGGRAVILAFNQIIAAVAAAYGVGVADVFGAFEGRTGLLLIERNGADLAEVHPTNTGYRAIAQAFAEVIQ